MPIPGMTQKVNPQMQQMQNVMACGMNMHQPMMMPQGNTMQPISPMNAQYVQQQQQHQQQRNAMMQQQQMRQQQQARYQQQQQRFAPNRMQNGANFNRQQAAKRVERKEHAQRAKAVPQHTTVTPTKSPKPSNGHNAVETKKPEPGMASPSAVPSTTTTTTTSTPTPAAKAAAATSPKSKLAEKSSAGAVSEGKMKFGIASRNRSGSTQSKKLEMVFGFTERGGKKGRRNRCSSAKQTAGWGNSPTFSNGERIVPMPPMEFPMEAPGDDTTPSPTDESTGTGSNADDAKDDDSKEHVPLDIVQEEEDDEKVSSVDSCERRRMEFEADMATNPHERRIKECVPFKCHKPKQPGLRANVFVSKECTRDLAKHIVDEQWGNDYGMLYKYLDYIFRCQIFEDEVKQVTYHYPSAVQAEESKEEHVVIFHTGLQRRHDHEFLFFVLKPNDADKQRVAEQRWRVPAGVLDKYCFSEDEMMSPPWALSEEQLPKRTKFYADNKELLFDDTYPVDVNWCERLRTNKERIYQELKQQCPSLDKGSMVSELSPVFDAAMQMAKKRAAANPRLTVAQGFVETKNLQKRVELLLPLRIEYPANSGKVTTFALALQRMEEPQRKYQGMSLLTLSMAYANARLVGYVDSSWLGSDSIPKISYAEQKKQRKQEQQEIKRKVDEERKRREEDQLKENERTQAVETRIQQQAQMQFQQWQEQQQAQMQQMQQAQMQAQRTMMETMKQQMQTQMQNQMQLWMQQQQPQRNNQPPQPQIHRSQIVHPHQQQMHHIQQQQQQRATMNKRLSQRHHVAPIGTTPWIYGQANRSKQNRARGGGKRKDEDTVEFLPPTQGTQRPFIDSVNPVAAIKETIAAPPRDLQLNFAMDDMAINDDVLFNDNMMESSMLAKGFEFPTDTERELNRLKISQSENVASRTTRRGVMRKDYSPRSRRLVWPSNLQQFKRLYDEEKIAVRNTSDVQLPADVNVGGDEDDATYFLMELSCLARDCGPIQLRDLFPADWDMESVHLVVEEQMALLRFGDAEQLQQALRYAQSLPIFSKWNPQCTNDGAYCQFGDDEVVWQYQDSNRWTACHPAMAALIETQQNSTFQIIVHGEKTDVLPRSRSSSQMFFIEKYNGSQGRLTNLRTSDQRPIRRVQIKAWVQPGADAPTEPSAEEKAIDFMIGAVGMENPGPLSEHIPNTNTGDDREANAVRTHCEPEREVVMNKEWEILTTDDDVWETMATYCEMDESPDDIEAVWRWTGASPIADGLNKYDDALVYIPERDDAVDLLETGRFEGGDGSDAKMINITLCATVAKAIELNTFEDECDDKGNVKVFACNVVLNEEQREQLEDEEFIEMTNAQLIELVMCGSINLEKLKEANPVDDDE